MSIKSAATAPSRFSWSPYIVGASIGVLSWLVFVITAKPLGISTAISALSGGVMSPFVGADMVAANTYWKRHGLSLNYGMLFLIGTFLGALVSSVVSGRFNIETVPSEWAARFGDSKIKRYAWAIVGGILVMYGARMAGGCTSGNGISQSLQLAVVGWTFLVFMFISGLLTAWVMFKRR
jgi:uncharacterized membrane protein YedE/YeeE